MNSKSKSIVSILISIITIIILQTNILAVEEGNNQQQTNTTVNQQLENTVTNTTTQSQENTLTTNNTTNTQKNAVTNNKTTVKTTKSNNANLKNLGIKPNDFKGFNPNTTTYTVTVSENVENIEIYATAANTKATISGIGNKKLENGQNVENIVVTAEDGTQKTYTINIIRGNSTDENEKSGTDETTEIKEGLSNIAISGVELSPQFDRNIYYYTAKYIGENDKLNIQAVPTESTYVVDIVGNENLQDGENIITILVSDKNAENIATYQITLEKSLVDNEKIAREEQEKQKEEMKKKFLAIIGGILLVIIIVVIIIVKKKRNKKIAEEFSGMNYTQNSKQEEDLLKQNLTDTKVQNKEKVKKSRNKEEEKEFIEKEKAKKEFLNEYNSNKNRDYSKESEENNKKKGKRFKE